MFTVKTLNSIAAIGTDRLDRALFCLDDKSECPAAIMVRSAKMHDCAFNPELMCIARAGAGVNNIPLERCAENGIVVFNSPGANANGVKELVFAAMLMASRDLIGGIEWVKSIAGKGNVAAAVEKGKSAFVGPEILGKTLGVIGLGAIGAKVADSADALGMKVIGYDPFISDSMRVQLAGKATFADKLPKLYAEADYITLHLPYNDATEHTINADALALMKDGVVIINLARGELVDDDAIIAAIKSGKVAKYVTDFPNDTTAGVDGIIAFPHLGASTPESEENCAIMAADEINEFILNGNIVNSVNFPNAALERSGVSRVVILHRNVDGSSAALLSVISTAGLSIAGSVTRSRGAYSVNIVDLTTKAPDDLGAKLEAVDCVIRVRVL